MPAAAAFGADSSCIRDTESPNILSFLRIIFFGGLLRLGSFKTPPGSFKTSSHTTVGITLTQLRHKIHSELDYVILTIGVLGYQKMKTRSGYSYDKKLQKTKTVSLMRIMNKK